MMSFSPRLAASALTVASLCLAGSAQAAPQAAKSTTVDVWEGTMPGVAPAEERAKQKEGTIETKDAHNAADTVVFNVTHPTLEICTPHGQVQRRGARHCARRWLPRPGLRQRGHKGRSLGCLAWVHGVHSQVPPQPHAQ